MVPNFEDIWYTRPIAPSIHSVNSQSSGTRSPGNGIPEGLQLKLILGGHTCPPCSVRDFKVQYLLILMLIAQEYLDRIEHSGENLAFYLWFKGTHLRVAMSSYTKNIKRSSLRCLKNSKNCLQSLISKRSSRRQRPESLNWWCEVVWNLSLHQLHPLAPLSTLIRAEKRKNADIPRTINISFGLHQATIRCPKQGFIHLTVAAMTPNVSLPRPQSIHFVTRSAILFASIDGRWTQ